MKKCRFGKLAGKCDVHPRGSSSFNMHDRETLLEALAIQRGDVILDLGCGPGDYSLECARIAGNSGKVHALERQSELLDDLMVRAGEEGITNIQISACDIAQPLPLKDQSIDVCLIVTVLHHPAVSPHMTNLFAEIHRVLKPDGRLVTIDVKKDDPSFGPPMHMRIAPGDLESFATEHGFKVAGATDFEFTYLRQFSPV